MRERTFSSAMKGITDPELKREAITQTFYKKVFRDLVLKSKATVLLQGTILTDVEETAAGIKRQHNVFEQIGIDPKKAFGYKISEPLVQLRKDGVRKVGMALGLQKSLFDRIPFPGPALAARVIGEVTPMKIALVRKATVIVEEELQRVEGLPVHGDPPRGPRHGYARRQTGLRPADRDPLLGQHRCQKGHADKASLAYARADRREDSRQRARRGERDLQSCDQAAFHDRGHLSFLEESINLRFGKNSEAGEQASCTPASFHAKGELKKRWRMIATVYILICMKADCRLGLCAESAMGEWN